MAIREFTIGKKDSIGVPLDISTIDIDGRYTIEIVKTQLNEGSVAYYLNDGNELFFTFEQALIAGIDIANNGPNSRLAYPVARMLNLADYAGSDREAVVREGDKRSLNGAYRALEKLRDTDLKEVADMTKADAVVFVAKDGKRRIGHLSRYSMSLNNALCVCDEMVDGKVVTTNYPNSHVIGPWAPNADELVD